jgi:hypothetical protein
LAVWFVDEQRFFGGEAWVGSRIEANKDSFEFFKASVHHESIQYLLRSFALVTLIFRSPIDQAGGYFLSTVKVPEGGTYITARKVLI